MPVPDDRPPVTHPYMGIEPMLALMKRHADAAAEPEPAEILPGRPV